MRFFNGAADEKYIRIVERESLDAPHAVRSFKFIRPAILRGKPYFDRKDVPLQFKTSPESLLNLCAMSADTLMLPSVYEWSNVEVLRWIREYGYPQYQNTFRENLISGRKMLLLDPCALAAMNITNFEHLRHIAYGIRQLFYFEMAKFGRSISLTTEDHYDLYKLLRVRTGETYNGIKPTALWRSMKMLRERYPYHTHWELLERWLARAQSPDHEMVGLSHRHTLIACPIPPPQSPPTSTDCQPCTCTPPCECFWTENQYEMSPMMSLMRGKRSPYRQISCTGRCMPPCTCHWPARFYRAYNMLGSLREAFPHRYGSARRGRRRGSENLVISDVELMRTSIIVDDKNG